MNGLANKEEAQLQKFSMLKEAVFLNYRICYEANTKNLFQQKKNISELSTNKLHLRFGH